MVACPRRQRRPVYRVVVDQRGDVQKLDGAGHESRDGGVVVMELGGEDGDGGSGALADALQGVGQHGGETRKVLFGDCGQVGADEGPALP